MKSTNNGDELEGFPNETEEISNFATRILFGTDLQEKLRSPKSLSDLKPLPALEAIPNTPHRNHDFKLLSLGQNKRHKRELSPNKERLQEDRFRARILHTFAHHELISLELMALALLRFPDAPKAFRRGLAKVIIDEQKHFKLYEERVRALGLSLGEEPVSDYFWRCVAHAPNLKAFNARLALVFEQANIDFTRHYAPLFKEVGDIKSAVALDQIYNDEISHVGLGLHWFRKWRPNNEPEWDSFCQLLEPPLSPGRAKGSFFSVEGRRAVGFSEDYIERLRLWGGSTGRPPLIWLGHFDFDEALHDQAVAKGLLPPDKSPKRRSKRRKTRERTQHAFTPLLAWLCTRGDIILCPKSVPSRDFQELLIKARGINPEWSVNSSEFQNRKLGGLSPWGWSPQSKLQLSCFENSILATGKAMPSEEVVNGISVIASKLELSHLRKQLKEQFEANKENCPLYFPLSSLDIVWSTNQNQQTIQAVQSVQHLLDHLRAQSNPSSTWIAKRAYGSAGRGLKKIDITKEIDQATKGWLERSLPLGLNVEPWLDRVADLSFHAWIDGKSIRYEGEVAGIIDQHGRFQGAYISPPSSVFDTEIKMFLNGQGQDKRRLRRIGKSVTQLIGQTLIELGYEGPFGIDALIAKVNHASMQLYPLIDINPRFTMGRLALMLRKHLNLKANPKAHFRIYPKLGVIPQNEIIQAQLASDESQWNMHGQWQGEIIPLNDIWQAGRDQFNGQEHPVVLLYK